MRMSNFVFSVFSQFWGLHKIHQINRYLDFNLFLWRCKNELDLGSQNFLIKFETTSKMKIWLIIKSKWFSKNKTPDFLGLGLLFSPPLFPFYIFTICSRYSQKYLTWQILCYVLNEKENPCRILPALPWL